MSSVPSALAWLALTACGRLRFDALGDASSDGTQDACVLGPWSTPIALGDLESAGDDYGPALSPDGQMIVFSSTRASGSDNDLYVSQRVGPTTFSAPQRLAVLDTSSYDFSPAWSPDGAQLYFSSDRVGGIHLYVSSQHGGVFDPPTMVPDLATEPVSGSTISTDGLELFYDQTNGPPLNIYRAVRASVAASWELLGQVPELNTNADDGYPSLSHDGLTIYFESSRTGDTDLYVAERPQVGAPFGTPVRIAELAASGYDGDADISADDRTIVFASTRTGGAGSADLYMSTRSCR